MIVAASWSGGKDSALALWRAIAAGARPLALLNMSDESGQRSRSHGLRPEVLAAQADSLGIELLTGQASWADYEQVFVGALHGLRARGVEQVVFGDIDLDAHRFWEEKVCVRAGLQAWLPLWQASRRSLVDEMIGAGFVARLSTVREDALPASFLGRTLDADCVTELESLGVDPCGEGGEFHTVVVDGPLFRQPLTLQTGDIHRHGGCAFIDFYPR
ncbi:diphthine--ammonia ligase [Microvirgula curvata]